MTNKTTANPGTKTPTSGLYDLIGPRGGNTGRQCDSTQGNPLPPTPQAGQKWQLNTPARHTDE